MRSWKANYTAVLIAEVLAIIGFGLSIPIIPLFLEEDIGMTDPVKLKVWVGLINSGTAVAMAIFAPIWGHLADIYSRRAMLLRAMFGGAILISFLAFVNSPLQLLVLKTIQGCITGTVAAATVLVVGITPASQVAFALGLLQTGVAVGSSLGPLIGGLLSDFFGHRIAFFSTGLFLGLGGLIVLKGVDKDTKPRIEGEHKKFSLIPDIKPIVSSPILISLLFVTFGVQAANAVALPLLPLFLKSLVQNISAESSYIASTSGVVLGVGAAAAALAAVLAGKVSTRIGYWTTLILCLGAGALVTAPQALVTNVPQLIILRALSSFFIGGTMPVINAIIAVSSEKNNQGTIFGFNSSVAFVGAAIGPMIGSASAMISYRAVFLASAAVLGISVLETIRQRKKSA